MPTQVLFYSNAQPVNQTRHKDLCVKTGPDFSFAKDTNSVPLMAVEFPHAASEYAIMFAGSEEKPIPVVIMGYNESENRYIDEDEQWRAKYIPAFIRRYPFVFSSSDDGDTLTLCVDEEYDGCNEDGHGERLFDADGERTLFLNNTLKFLEEYQAHYYRTENFCKTLKELDLLEPVTARFTTPDGQQRNLTGIQSVSRKKMKELSEADLHKLHQSDGLELIYLHLHSSRNLQNMLEMGSAEGTKDTEAAAKPKRKSSRSKAKKSQDEQASP